MKGHPNSIAMAFRALVVAPLIAFSLAKPLEKPSAVVDLLPRQTIIPSGKPCGQNNATNRMCWKNNWNVSTDYEIVGNYPPAFNNRIVRCAAVQFREKQGVCLPADDSTTSASPMSQIGRALTGSSSRPCSSTVSA